MPFDGLPPSASPPTQLVDNMLRLLATRDQWLRNKEKELGKDGVLRVCLLGAYKVAMQELPLSVRFSAGNIVLRTLNEVICSMTRPTDYQMIKRMTRYGLVRRSLMVAFNDDGRNTYWDVMTILRVTRERVQPVTVIA